MQVPEVPANCWETSALQGPGRIAGLLYEVIGLHVLNDLWRGGVSGWYYLNWVMPFPKSIRFVGVGLHSLSWISRCSYFI